jgi:hypothetical protein
MDFNEGLPCSKNANSILVIVDKFTRYGHFVSLSHPYTATTVAALFMDTMYKLHGVPAGIISDRDSIFTCNFWQQLFMLSGTLKMSSSYHPQTDGQTKRVNQCLKTFLRCFVNACPGKWKLWLASAEFWYNTSFQSSLGCSPFEALYGRQPSLLGLSPPDAAAGNLQTWLTEHALMNQLIRQHLCRAQEHMKRQADKHRSEGVHGRGYGISQTPTLCSILSHGQS